MLERFDRSARAAVVQARSEARNAGQLQMSSAHLLIGLLGQPGEAADTLVAAGLSQTGLRARLPQSIAGPAEELDGEALALVGVDLDAVRRATDEQFMAAMTLPAVPQSGTATETSPTSSSS